MSELITFGKYKGQPVEVLQKDRQYADWLMQQSWFGDRHPEIRTLIINNFAEPSETPEHNAMQVLFFKPDMQSKLLNVLSPKFHTWIGDNTTHIADYRFDKFLEEYLKDFTIKVEAEVKGFDIHFKSGILKEGLAYQDKKLDIACNFEAFIELKPTMSDDYPAVLRQIKANKDSLREHGEILLIVGEYTGIGATWEDVKMIFKSSGIKAILMSDIHE
jgi:hypothetical protein